MTAPESRADVFESIQAANVARRLHAEATKSRTRLFRGQLDGRDVLVTIHDPEGYGEIAMREGEGRWSRWGAPFELHEEA